jgi:uncharacterized LabA/DUF88 family protein
VTNVYIDGFNLYYGAVKNTPYRWLDLSKFCHLLLPRHQIARIKYFTAQVTALPWDAGQPVRQQAYLRALATLPNVEIIYGHFQSNVVQMPLSDGSGYASVIKAEEKGSDVALATHLLHDAHKGEYEVAVIVSNDSDLVPPIRIVRQELGKVVGLVYPHRRVAARLRFEVDFLKEIRTGVLRASQFPPSLEDANGIFCKPPSW